jgi:hypothetical protein
MAWDGLLRLARALATPLAIGQVSTSAPRRRIGTPRPPLCRPQHYSIVNALSTPISCPGPFVLTSAQCQTERSRARHLAPLGGFFGIRWYFGAGRAGGASIAWAGENETRRRTTVPERALVGRPNLRSARSRWRRRVPRLRRPGSRGPPGCQRIKRSMARSSGPPRASSARSTPSRSSGARF